MGQEAYTWTPKGDINFRINCESEDSNLRPWALDCFVCDLLENIAAEKLMGGCNLEADHKELVDGGRPGEEPNGAEYQCQRRFR
jgi:hypothetical protein